jgi:hypothetical protein
MPSYLEISCNGMISCLRRSHTKTAKNACRCASQSPRQTRSVIHFHAAMLHRGYFEDDEFGSGWNNRIVECNHDCRHALLMDEVQLCLRRLPTASSGQVSSRAHRRLRGSKCGEMQGSSGLTEETSSRHFRSLIGWHGRLTIPGKAADESDTP